MYQAVVTVLPLSYRILSSQQRIPNFLLKRRVEPLLLFLRHTDVHEGAGTILCTGMVEVVLPDAGFVTVNDVFDPGEELDIPLIDLTVGAIRDVLRMLIHRLQHCDSSYNNTVDLEFRFSTSPRVSGELRSKRPLFGPRITQLGGGLFVTDESASEVRDDSIHPAAVDNRLASIRT